MNYTWTCSSKKLIETILARGYELLTHRDGSDDFEDNGTFYFSKTKDLEKLNSQNVIIVKKHNIYTYVEFSPDFDKKELDEIHAAVNDFTLKHGFVKHYTFLLQNKKTNEYKLIMFQPLFIMGMLLSLGAFDYSSALEGLKLNDKQTEKEKMDSLFQHLIDTKFKIVSQMVPEFNVYDSAGPIEVQISEHYGQDWNIISISPEDKLSDLESMYFGRRIYSNAVLEKLEELFKHSVEDKEKNAIEEYNAFNTYHLIFQFAEFMKIKQAENKDLAFSDIFKEFECAHKYNFPSQFIKTVKRVINRDDFEAAYKDYQSKPKFEMPKQNISSKNKLPISDDKKYMSCSPETKKKSSPIKHKSSTKSKSKK